MKKIIFILIFSFNSYLNSLEGVDECSEFIKLVNSESEINYFSYPDEYELPRLFFTNEPTSYGYDSEPVYKRDKSNRVFINYINDCWESFNKGNCVDGVSDNQQTYEINSRDVVVSINGFLTEEMSDDDIDGVISIAHQNKKDLNLTIMDLSNNIKDVTLEYAETFDDFLVPIGFEIKNIEKIDSATSTYKTRYEQRIPIFLQDMERIIEKIFNKSSDKESIYVLDCQYTNEEFMDVKIWKPKVAPKNIVSSEGDSNFIDYRLVMERWPSQVAFEEGFVDFINEGKFIYFYSLQQVTDSIATFKGSFDYRSFPLDRQTLRFDFQNRDQRGLMYFYEYTDGYKNGFNNLELYEWKKTNFEMDLIRDQAMTGGNAVIASYQINIERNYVYFITKIYLPIVIILLLALSVMWINPKELESRLTLSVVCFLALITYTFIIDKDLPKLPYLTVMDQIILISYVFAAIPSLESIYVNRFGVANEKAELIDSKYRKYLPLLYIFFTLLIIFLSINFNNDNIIEALSFTT